MAHRDRAAGRGDPQAKDARARAALALAGGTTLVAAPIRALWTEATWWAPFALWGLLVAFGVITARALERRPRA